MRLKVKIKSILTNEGILWVQRWRQALQLRRAGPFNTCLRRHHQAWKDHLGREQVAAVGDGGSSSDARPQVRYQHHPGVSSDRRKDGEMGRNQSAAHNLLACYYSVLENRKPYHDQA